MLPTVGSESLKDHGGGGSLKGTSGPRKFPETWCPEVPRALVPLPPQGQGPGGAWVGGAGKSLPLPTPPHACQLSRQSHTHPRI